MFRGDMVEVLKGPDKGKLGIIKMIVQVGKLRPICSLLLSYFVKVVPV